MSLNDVTLLGGSGIESNWTGLGNWGRMFTDSNVWAGWLAMIIYFVATVGLEMILGLVIALVIHEVAWGKNLALSLVLIPMFIAPVIVGLLGRFWSTRPTGSTPGSSGRAASTTGTSSAVPCRRLWPWC